MKQNGLFVIHFTDIFIQNDLELRQDTTEQMWVKCPAQGLNWGKLTLPEVWDHHPKALTTEPPLILR